MSIMERDRSLGYICGSRAAPTAGLPGHGPEDIKVTRS
jgi:hypothetical protein